MQTAGSKQLTLWEDSQNLDSTPQSQSPAPLTPAFKGALSWEAMSEPGLCGPEEKDTDVSLPPHLVLGVQSRASCMLGRC
jgi:hypothetical protein